MSQTPSRRSDVPTHEPGAARGRMVAAVLVVLAVFAAVVALASVELRARWRSQVLLHEGDVLRAVATMQNTIALEDAEFMPGSDEDRALEVALNTSKLRGVLAVRIFDTGGTFRDAVPAEVDEGRLAPEDMVILGEGEPVVRFHPHHAIASLFLVASTGAEAPLLEVTTPLLASGSSARPVAMIQYWIDGRSLADDFRQLDRSIVLQALAAFVAGAVLILGSLGWGFRRLAQANRMLVDRARDLALANREFAQTARTAALGAITAHLVHSVRSPLAGLEGLVASQSGAGAGAGAIEDWQSALESTRRIRALLDEVQAIMGDVSSGAEFEVTAAELCAGLRERLGPVAARRQVALDVRVREGGLVLGAREAGLGGLVLANLVQNAIEASPQGGTVVIEVSDVDAGQLGFLVRDAGPGLPAEVAAEPFRPRRSSKPDGAGIGLAISHQLARHAGGAIELVRTGTSGTEFRLVVPAARSRSSRPVS